MTHYTNDRLAYFVPSALDKNKDEPKNKKEKLGWDQFTYVIAVMTRM